MDRLDLFRIFTRVVECASFTRAAGTLGLPRSSVSTAVRDLEMRVSARLLHRTTRQVAPTQEGAAFYERCLRLLAEIEETENLFRHAAAAPRGKLRLDVPGRIGRLIVAPALPAFLERYPELEIELGVTDRAVNLIEEDVDCALRVGPLSDSSLIARKLGELDLINVASPAYLSRHGMPARPADLGQHRVVRYASPTSGRVEPWEWLDNGALRSRPLAGSVTVNNAEAYLACCLAGLGLIQVPAYDVRAHLARGELVEVLPKHRAAPMPITLLYPHRRPLARRIQVLLDWVTALVETAVLQD
jgi:DNA-binding transcriptional LysR family regulator